MDIELRNLTEGSFEARTKIKKIFLPLLLALKLKTSIIFPIIITIIAIVGLKGLTAGMLSLLLSGSIALKSLLTSPRPQYPARVSYGILKPEVHHDHWHRIQEEINQPFRNLPPEYNTDPYFYPDL
ncbi:uncharacterized protein LOC122859500 [Aphidius gifuensis]|uniref:uncharacterized protein LOC122859500 n=1 Tax=Aphidius gifuensis TaxID=684658 RepID=UPI001CDD8650|nr:uncharacterized protein LOC122859500 [Aphidius gifuensis]